MRTSTNAMSRRAGKKYQTVQVHPMSAKSAATLSVADEVDLDQLLHEINSDVDAIMHSTYMDKLSENDNKRGGRKQIVPGISSVANARAEQQQSSARASKKRIQQQQLGDAKRDDPLKGLESIQEVDQDNEYTARTHRTEQSAEGGDDDDEGTASDSSGDGDDVMLSHTQDAASMNPQKTLEEIRSLMDQVNVKLSESNEMSKELFRLTATIHELEDENHDLHEAMEEAVKHVQDANASTLNSTMKIQAVNTTRRGKAKGEDKKKVNGASVMLDGDEDDGDLHLEEFDVFQTNPFEILKLIEAWIERNFPFKSDIQRIHAMCGGTVSSYFLFTRWLVLQYALVSALVCVFMVYHVIAQRDQENMWELSPGLLPKFMLYSSFSSAERFNYSIMVTLGIAIMVVNGLLKYIREDRVSKQEIINEGENFTSSYSKDILVAWENSLVLEQDIENYKGSLTQLYKEKLKDSEEAGIKKALTDIEKAILYLRRFLGNIIFIAFLALIVFFILYLTIEQATVGAYATNISPSLESFSGSIPSIAVNIINSISPEIIKLITAFEKWDRAQTLSFLLGRMYVANVVNVIILALQYLLLANPYLLATNEYSTVRSTIEAPFDNSSYKCRMDMVQNGFFQLIVTDWVSKLISFYISGIIPYITSWVTGGELSKVEFDLPPMILTGIFSAGLALMAWPFSPLSMIITPFMIAATIKFERFCILKYYQKPKEQWKSQKAIFLFTYLYMLTVLLFGMGISLYFLNTETLPKSCSIQDTSIGLCTSTLSSNNTCVLDASSDYYKGTNQSTICGNAGYPKCICEGDLACGPFTTDQSALAPIRHFIYKLEPLKIFYEIFFVTSYGAWFLVIAALTIISLRRNTLKVDGAHFKDIEIERNLRIKVLEAENAKSKKTIARYKSIREQELQEHEEEQQNDGDGEEEMGGGGN